PSPFSPAHAESCAEALYLDKIRTGAIDPAHSILAGHSLGGAIALRLASRHPVAGVLAISPAPLTQAPGVEPEILFFPLLSQPPPHSLFLSASLDPTALRNSAAALAAAAPSSSPAELRVVPASTHASLIFDATALRISLDWTARLLSLPLPPALPWAPAILGSNLGLLGLLLLAGIFLKFSLRSFLNASPAPSLPPLSYSRYYLSIALSSALAVFLLIFGVPLRFLHIFTADYLASFSLITALFFFAVNPATALSFFSPRQSTQARPFALASVLGLATAFLFFLWFRFSFTTTWLDLPRLGRLAPLSLALFPFLALEESLLHPSRRRSYALRLAESLAVRFIAWLALVFAVYHLHSAQVLLVLMAPFFVFFSIFHRLAIDLFRRESPSPAAAAFFGAILAAGFLVLILPLT
ncbi:MAG: hypothetical protein LAN71_14110, partial [Acidobacteriia bacterium]|nr:hypothetical protein [Terriglobia bacterium]